MNRGQLVHAVARKLGFSEIVGTDELAMMQDLANEGVVDVLLKTHAHVDIGEMSLTSGVDNYTVDSAVLAMLNDRISSVNGIYTFEVVQLQDVIEYQQGISPVAGPPSVMAIEGDLMVIWPTPTSTDIIRYFFVPRPSPMTADSHDPSVVTYGGIPTEYHRAIEYYMLWQGAEYDDKSSALKPMDYFQLYTQECAQARKESRGKRGRTLTRPRVGYPGTQRYPHRNDVYPSR